MIARMIIVLILLGLVFGSIFGYKSWQQSEMTARMRAAGPPMVTVSSSTVREERWQRQVNAVGSLRAIQGVEVSPEVAGVVADISFDSGNSVETGTVLVRLDATAEEAELRSLEAQLVLAQQDYDRAKGLEVKTVLSQAQLDRARSVMDSLAAQAEEQVALIARKTIRAPFGGELGIRQINLGEYLSPGTPIVTLQKLDPIFVDFTVPEKNLHRLALTQSVDVELAALPGRSFRGTITAISPKVTTATRNVEVQATLENAEALLRPGMFARVAVIIGETETVLTLPRTAVDILPYGNSVFLIEGNEELTVRRHQVKTGRIIGNRIEVLSGVQEGDRVVQSGQLKLRNGQNIKIDNSVELPEGATQG